MKRPRKLMALLLALSMVLSLLAGCGSNNAGKNNSANVGNNATANNTADDSVNTDQPPEEAVNTKPLVIGQDEMESDFTPFFSSKASDQDVWEMVTLKLLTADREGSPVAMGATGEVRTYNGTDYTYTGPLDMTITQNEDGTVYYDLALREDIYFSDGKQLTVDDIIFSMYVICDPDYTGGLAFYSLPIEGLEAYVSGMEVVYELMTTAGPDGYVATDCYTEEQYNYFWNAYWTAGEAFVTDIAEAMAANGTVTAATDMAGVATALGVTGETAAEVFQGIVAAKGYAVDAVKGASALAAFKDLLKAELGDRVAEFTMSVQSGESAANISGIQKIDDFNMRLVMTKFDATVPMTLYCTPICPLHYYGDESLYDYDNNSFGFVKGDLSVVRAVSTVPMGAGPYKFVKYENGVVYFEANEYYFKGAPKTKYVQFMETNSTDELNGILTGTIDLGRPAYTSETVAAVKEANGGELTGAKLTTVPYYAAAYTYIGIDGRGVSVNHEPGSDASKNLRKAFATVFSVYRDLAIDSYYGELADIINYPMSATNWASPQPTDDDYEIAFTKDINGDPIYTDGMTDDERYAAALQAALGYFEAAGYTVEDGKLTAAPEGASLEYEFLIQAGGTGDNALFMLVTMASDALATIGMNLIVVDLTSSAEIWTRVGMKTITMWTAGWNATADPDMYQLYYSQQPYYDGYTPVYSVGDVELDQLILDARASSDQSYRKLVYKAAMDKLMDWAVNLPVCQTKQAWIYNTAAIKEGTMTPDITTHYDWMMEVENIEMN